MTTLKSGCADNARATKQCNMTIAVSPKREKMRVSEVEAPGKELFINEGKNEVIEVPARGYQKSLNRSRSQGRLSMHEVRSIESASEAKPSMALSKENSERRTNNLLSNEDPRQRKVEQCQMQKHVIFAKGKKDGTAPIEVLVISDAEKRILDEQRMQEPTKPDNFASARLVYKEESYCWISDVV